jgi:DNA (cytosine-5)-methyltransferase 1
MNTKRLTVADLFSGAGGLSLGFHNAGFEIRSAVDFDKDSVATYNCFFGEGVCQLIDLSKTAAVQTLAESIKGVDVLVAGPPCQGFSLTGPRKFEDPRNTLYLSALEVAGIARPRAVLIENVRGMANLYGGAVRREVERRLMDLGYTVDSQVLDVADFGVPQHRKRLFFVAMRDQKVFEWPTPTFGPNTLNAFRTCSEAISDLSTSQHESGNESTPYPLPPMSEYQATMRSQSKQLHNHIATKHSNLVKAVIAHVPPGGNYRDLPPGIGDSRKFNVAWTRYHPDRPASTIDTGHRNHFHYSLNRVPTIRENARLQSFPDNFIFSGTRTSQNRQVGNAVPPLMAEVLARAIAKSLA